MSEAKRKPAAFMSYSHADTEVERLTEFRERLSQEVSKQIGEEFPIFQDEDGVLWGQNWQERIEESLNEVTFFIPIITPGFIKSAHCRAELKQFLAREKQLNRKDLILGVYYRDYPLMNDKMRRSADELVEAIAMRQYADWRGLRLAPKSDPWVEQEIAQLAAAIRDLLERVQQVSLPRSEPARERDDRTQRPSVQSEPPTHIVDMYLADSSHHATIAEAIDAASPGDRILVRPGFYQERVIVDKPLEIIGDGDVGEVEIQGVGESALVFATTQGGVANLTLSSRPQWVETKRLFFTKRQVVESYGAEIVQGRLELEGCDISSDAAHCVYIHGGAQPRLRRNRIHDGAGSESRPFLSNARAGCGVCIEYHAQATLEENDIFGNGGYGVDNSGNATLRRNRIHESGDSGIYAGKGRLTLEDNDIFDNGGNGVYIYSNITLRRNRIVNNRQLGLRVVNTKPARVTAEDNYLSDNGDGQYYKGYDGVFTLDGWEVPRYWLSE